jgi:Kef-type K+ transport system membrane component KefB
VPANLMALVIALMFGMAICTYKLGIFAIFGGFAAGLLFHRHEAFVDAWRRQVGRFVMVFFLPVFFTYTGLRTNVLGLSTASDVQWLGVILAASILGKILPVYLGGRLCGFDHNQSAVLGSLMNTRALMELIVLNIGFDLGFIPQNVFTMLVIMAVVTTVMTGPLLKVLLPRTGHSVPLGVEA